MPYFEPQPTAAELTAWLFPNGQPHKVPGWPRPQTSRVDRRFRMEFTVPIDAWTSSRYLFRYLRDNPAGGGAGGPRIDRWGWFDLELNLFGDLRAEIDPDFDDTVLIIEVESEDPLDLQPGAGVWVQAIASIPGIGGARMYYEWGLLGPRPWRFNVQFATYPFNRFSEVLLPVWAWQINQFRAFAVTDCYTFPRIP